jgi:hypothetical protein
MNFRRRTAMAFAVFAVMGSSRCRGPESTSGPGELTAGSQVSDTTADTGR